MVKVDFSHNPYLVETKILLNGKHPKVGSVLERCADLPLTDWVTNLPDILRNEMNGYDFDLNFEGTRADFHELTAAFRVAGVNADDVRIFHARELEDVWEKRRKTLALFRWLEENRSRMHDAHAFASSHADLQEASFPFIFLHGEGYREATGLMDIEAIEDIADLEDTDLTNTPILLFITHESRPFLIDDIEYLLTRKGINPVQLFFSIDSALNIDRVTRVIADSGIANPQVVSDIDDENIVRFIACYPIAEYVRMGCKVYQNEYRRIEQAIAEAESTCKTNCVNERKIIEKLDRELEALAEAGENFERLPAYGRPPKADISRTALVKKLEAWKIHKTMATGEAEIARFAAELDRFARDAADSFHAETSSIVKEEQRLMESELANTYAKAGVDAAYVPRAVTVPECPAVPLPLFTDSLFAMRKETRSAPKGSPFALFIAPEVDEDGLVRTVNSNLADWRKTVVESVRPLADAALEECVAALESNRNALASDYRIHVSELITEREREKERIASGLSAEEKALQKDKDWLLGFREQLQSLRRG